MAAVPPTVKVVRVIARLNVGGPARQATILNDGLRQHHFDSLLVYGSLEPSEGSLEDLVVSLGLRAHKVPELGRRVSLWGDVRALYQLTLILFHERPDVVHTHTAKAGTLGRLAALVYNMTRRRERRCAVIHTFHGHVFSGYFGPVATTAVRMIERGMALVTDRILTISASQKHDICDRYRIAPSRKTEIVELGTELDALLTLESDDRLRTELGLAPDAVVFGYVGRFVPIKDLSTLIRAFGLLAGRAPQARLMLVGDGEQRSTLEQLAAELGLTDRIWFAGWRRDLDAVYGSTDVAVLSSLNEGTPVALIEAMAAARPVIATADGGVRDVVHHERNGLVVPAQDPGALADAMERLTRDSDTRRRFGQSARQDVAARFGRRRLEAEISRVYRRVLAEKRGERDVDPAPDPRT
jgi:glycosyltransferase involved in cell wall biosynthesis